MELQIRALHPVFAAEVIGIDLRQPPSAELARSIDAAMSRHGVLVLRDQRIDDDQQMAFAQSLGTIEAAPAVVDAQLHRLAHKQMVDISNLDVDGSILAADDRRRMFNLGNRLWHSDSSFKSTPAKHSMLHARVIPPDNPPTEFADMRAAWDALSPSVQSRLINLVCRHSLIYSRAQLGFEAFTESERHAFEPVRQRLVRRHPGSSRLSLYLSSHIGEVEGMPRPEGMAMIRDLIEHATQRSFVYAHAWKPDDLVIWDNRCTMHRARPFDDQNQRRDMRRITLQDSAPTLEQAI